MSETEPERLAERGGVVAKIRERAEADFRTAREAMSSEGAEAWRFRANVIMNLADELKQEPAT